MIESRSRHRRPAVPIAVIGTVLAAAVALTGCGHSGSSGAGTGRSTSPTATATSPAPPASSGIASLAIRPSAATVAAIRTSYAKFFDIKTPLAESIGLVQDGAAFRALLEQVSNSSLGNGASAAVSTVTLESADLAAVRFTILLDGKPVLANQPGYAVREDGIWKIAGKTICGLLALEQSKPPAACSSPAATSLPS